MDETLSMTPVPPTMTLAVPPSAATIVSPVEAFTVTPAPRPMARRVLIISFDGLRPEAIQKAPMKNLLALMQSSAYTLSARTVLPTVTVTAHASMLGGMCPGKHGAYWDDYVPENGYALGVDLFDLAHEAGLQTAMIVGKEKLRHVTEPESADLFVLKEDDAAVANWAVAEIKKDYAVMFVHFAAADVYGHEWGWMGRNQMWWLRQDDEFLGRILVALDEADMRADTLIIVTADHGGKGKSHGGDSAEETTIPWIASGPGVIPGPLTSAVHTTDTAATAAWILGLPLPSEWDGLPVYEAFGLPPAPRAGEVCVETR